MDIDEETLQAYIMRLENVDEIELIELLDITSADIADRFQDLIPDMLPKLEKYFGIKGQNEG